MNWQCHHSIFYFCSITLVVIFLLKWSFVVRKHGLLLLLLKCLSVANCRWNQSRKPDSNWLNASWILYLRVSLQLWNDSRSPPKIGKTGPPFPMGCIPPKNWTRLLVHFGVVVQMILHANQLIDCLSWSSNKQLRIKSFFKYNAFNERILHLAVFQN